MCDAYCRASEPCLGSRFGLGELAQAATRAPGVWSAQERSGDARTAPLPRSQVLASGAKVRPAVFQRLGHGGGPGSRGGMDPRGPEGRGCAGAKAVAGSLQRGLVRTEE